jgi:hypothetical protein
MLKTKRQVFSRKDTLARCPDFLVSIFTDLFRQIDELDLKINYYELAHDKRKNEPRDTLLIKFSEEEKEHLKSIAATWS